MTDRHLAPAADVLAALRRTRQVRQFTDEPVSDEDLEAILRVARWTGSASNRQPWTFLVLRDPGLRRGLSELAPNARHIAGAPVGIAIVMGGENPELDAYDEGRAAERILVAAGALGLGAGIGWIMPGRRPKVAELLAIAPPSFIRTIVSIGHPSETARRPKTALGTARRPLTELVQDR